MRRLVVLAVLIAVAPVGAAAQWADSVATTRFVTDHERTLWTAAPARAQSVRADSLVGDGTFMVAAGVLGGAIGLVGGAALGSALERRGTSPCSDYCGLLGGLLGGVIGESIGVAVGVHAANKGRGSLQASAFATMGIAAGGIALLALVGSDATVIPILIAIPVAQLATAVAVERATTTPDF